MKSFLFAVSLAFVLALAGCGGSVVDCLSSDPTLTPQVSLPTATPDELTPVTPLPTGSTCPTRTPAPSTTPPATVTAGPGLGLASSSMRTLTISPENEALLNVSVGNGQGSVIYLASGQLVIRTTRNWDQISLGQINLGQGDNALAAFGPDQIALAVSKGGQVAVRLGSRLAELGNASPLPATGGSDLALIYGPEGWLYLASGGQIVRLNPQSNAWESLGSYAGHAKQLVRLASGAMLLLVEDKSLVYRRDPGRSDWRVCWDTDDIRITVDGLLAHANPQAVAVLGEHVALAWVIAQGPTGGGGYWQATVSNDGCQSWSTPEKAAGGLGGWYGEVFPLLRSDDTLEVTGMFTEEGRYGSTQPAWHYAIIARKTGGDWFPPLGSTTAAQALTNRNEDLQPGRNMHCASESGFTLCAWEALQFNGSTHGVALTR